MQDVYAFKQAFDGHLFVGAKGNQYRATVEYAPFQKTPTLAPKKDTRDGTIVKGGYLILGPAGLRTLVCSTGGGALLPRSFDLPMAAKQLPKHFQLLALALTPHRPGLPRFPS